MGDRVLSGRYALLEEIGRGGAGRVHRAMDTRLERPVAVKELTDLGEASVARFRREAATAARVRHPNVVTLHDAGVDEVPYLVMTLVEGPSLASHVEASGPLDEAAVRRLAEDLFGGLEATHRAGVLHRDLTPRNVLFDVDGNALLADFGIARGPDDPTITAEHTIMGTRPFVAPERLRGDDATVASDLYAVGVTLRFAATGAHAEPMPTDHPLAPLVAACTAEEPGRRPASAEVARRQVAAIGDRSTPRTRAMPVETTVIEPDVAPGRRSRPPRPVPPAPARPEVEASPGTPRPSTTSRSVRPWAVLAVLAVAVLAAWLGSSAVGEDPATDGVVPGASEAETAPAPPVDDAPGGEPQGEPPTFDPADPAGSARRLAEWLRGG